MTSTARRVYDALVCDDAVTTDLGGDGAWDEILGDAVPVTPAFDSASQVGAPPNVVEALVYPNETAACLSHLTPSPALVEVLDVLSPAMLEVDGQLDALVAVQRHIGMLQAREAELLAALDGEAAKDEFTRDWVAAALRVPPVSMRTKMAVASDLTHRLPATLELLHSGGITARHASDLAEATRPLTPESTALVEGTVLERAAEQTVAQFRAAVKRAVLRVASPVEEEKAHTDAVAGRRVVSFPEMHGMATVNAFLSADDAATVMAALDAIARETIHGRGGDSRTVDQRRADALVDLCSAALGDPHLTRAHGQRPSVQVTIAASTLMGLDQQPAELDGYGPITAAMGRRIASDPTAQWRVLVTDDTGLVTQAGSKTYRPPADMARTVIARDVHCVFPGCRKKAAHTDLDHVQAYKSGDETSGANLMSLCRRHHRFKHEKNWTVTRDDTTGVTTWKDPKGRTYRTRPPTRPTTTTGTPETSPPADRPTTTTGTPETSPPAAPAIDTAKEPEPPPF